MSPRPGIILIICHNYCRVKKLDILFLIILQNAKEVIEKAHGNHLVLQQISAILEKDYLRIYSIHLLNQLMYDLDTVTFNDASKVAMEKRFDFRRYFGATLYSDENQSRFNQLTIEMHNNGQLI